MMDFVVVQQCQKDESCSIECRGGGERETSWRGGLELGWVEWGVQRVGGEEVTKQGAVM